MNLTYGYQAQAEQNGPGTTAGNSGQLMTVSGQVGGLTESAAYTYDLQGRIATSNQTTNAVSAQRRFAYDRWGNRTGMWDATSSGNQIQSISLQQSGGAPTNRIQSVTSGRVNVASATNGAVASASSTLDSRFPASGAINGDRRGTNWERGGGWHDATLNSYPDWIQVDFNGSKAIDEIDVFTLQDNYLNPEEPTESMTFSQWGIVNFDVQYWNGSSWVTVQGGSVTGNNKVWRRFTFPQVTTSKIRVHVSSGLAGHSRVTEIEAYQVAGGQSNHTYDAAGNVINDGAHSYEYDAENRLTRVDGGVTAVYMYDYANRRIKKVSGSVNTNYVWEGSQVISEHEGAAGAVIASYVYAGGQVVSKVSGDAVRYLLSDRLSVRLTLDSNGNVIGRQGHLPFGEEIGVSWDQDKRRFTTYERDAETNTDYAVNRQHAQNVGRFMQADPYRASGYKVDPQSWNRYSYVQNDPINRIDRLGLEWQESTVNGPGCYWDPETATVFCGLKPGFGGTSHGAPLEESGAIGGEGGGGGQYYPELTSCEKKLVESRPGKEVWIVNKSAKKGFEAASGLPGPHNGPGDAVRHCTWNCEMTRRLGQVIAKKWGDAHECDRPAHEQNEVEMDLHNNAVGRLLGYDSNNAEKSCADLCKEALNRDDALRLKRLNEG